MRLLPSFNRLIWPDIDIWTARARPYGIFAGAADYRRDDPVLEDAEQFGLQADVHGADYVQQESVP